MKINFKVVSLLSLVLFGQLFAAQPKVKKPIKRIGINKDDYECDGNVCRKKKPKVNVAKKTAAKTAKPSQEQGKLSVKSVNLNKSLRKLCTEQAVWTRLFIMSTLSNLSDAKFIAEKLQKNQAEFGKLMGSYYGKNVSTDVAKLLREHATLGKDIIVDIKSGNKTKLAKDNIKWRENAEQMATAISSVNQHLSKNVLLKLLNNRLDLTISEVQARVAKKWNEDINAFSKLLDNSLAMADTLSSAIVKQFPNKF